MKYSSTWEGKIAAAPNSNKSLNNILIITFNQEIFSQLTSAETKHIQLDSLIIIYKASDMCKANIISQSQNCVLLLVSEYILFLSAGIEQRMLGNSQKYHIPRNKLVAVIMLSGKSFWS